ncbi:hypothetical protein DYQ93_05150 [Xanthomonas sp. LMG 8992]|uniref:YciI family protein n=1 Tax=Xanthomonas sp. LMG 8992 TaxID=1591157 RepID=UPI001367AA49|nr:YciI family protein [Xanthomonas sp. LMG 8992]MXV10430.1 hypothetical protein [Xanthomonas sp. LMG 8992]
MLYIVALTYIRPPEDIQAHLDAHRHWLAHHIQAGRILAAGPNADKSGGIVLASCTSRSELDTMMADDPFVTQGLVAVSVQGFEPAIRADALAARWASAAAVVCVQPA